MLGAGYLLIGAIRLGMAWADSRTTQTSTLVFSWVWVALGLTGLALAWGNERRKRQRRQSLTP